MKKDFTLQLGGCSKADRKTCQELHDSVGGTWGDKDRFKSDSFTHIAFDKTSNTRCYVHEDNHSHVIPVVIYQMPQDWSKIQEALGVSVEVRYVELSDDSGSHVWYNGMKGDIFPVIRSYYDEDCYYHVIVDNGDNDDCLVILDNRSNPSTKEAYEAQEAEKAGLLTGDGSENLSSIILLPVIDYDLFGVDRIKELEEENEELKAVINITGSKSIIELEEVNCHMREELETHKINVRKYKKENERLKVKNYRQSDTIKEYMELHNIRVNERDEWKEAYYKVLATMVARNVL